MNALTANNDFPVTVLGGGVVGLCCALYLQREGYSVSLLDELPPGQSTAKWSCGQMAVSEIIPVSKPGLFRKVPGWLIDRLGPLAIRPSALPQLLPWMVRFAANARMSRIRQIASELGSLSQRVYEDYAPLLSGLETEELFNPNPPVQVFKNAKTLTEDQHYARILRELGFVTETLTSAQIGELEPAVAGCFEHGVLLNDWRTVRDTEAFLRALNKRFLDAGGERVTDRVLDLDCSGDEVNAVLLEHGGRRSVSTLILAAGHGSRRFFGRLGIRAPLIAIAGYQVVVRDAGVELGRSIIYSDGGFGMVPMTRGLQIGGTIEFVGHDERPNFERSKVILKRAKEILPRLDSKSVEYGVGFRPALPDTKPVIDRVPGVHNAILAFGHGQLGLTLGATTGRLVADLVARRSPAVSLTPFSLSRF